MKTIIFLLLIGIAPNVFSQDATIEQYIRDGIKLHDEGNFDGALVKYKMALSIDKTFPWANYEIANTYMALQKYDLAINHCDLVILSESDIAEQAYVIKGTAYDYMGKIKKAIETYKKGILKYSKSYLLNYNLGYSYYSIKDWSKTENAVQNALVINPKHLSSHLLMAFLMNDEGKHSKSILALLNYLLLDPVGPRSKTALELLESEFVQGVEKINENNTAITLNLAKDSDEFSAAELMISMLEASKNLPENKNKTRFELFISNTESFLTTMSELKKNNKGFWWDFYVDFFVEVIKEKQVETTCYYISQLKEDEKIDTWLRNNQDKIKALTALLSKPRVN